MKISADTTGTHSIYTKFADIELMFHVAPMLPHFKADIQQVEKKRHLGNDIVVIIFNDSTEPYSPHTIKTEFNRNFPLRTGDFELICIFRRLLYYSTAEFGS